VIKRKLAKEAAGAALISSPNARPSVLCAAILGFP
jgi:hypothetical protein